MNDDVEILEHRWCPVHECNLYGRDCTECWGEGAYHDCDDDCCCCADPEGDLNVRCSECRGIGTVEWCPKWTEASPCSRKDWKRVKTDDECFYEAMEARERKNQ